MTFIHYSMLFGLLATLVPIILHILNRRHAKDVEWGAMQFLLGSLVNRRRRILLEEMMLLAMRCLLMALIVLAIAQPIVPANSRIPWILVLPLILLGPSRWASALPSGKSACGATDCGRPAPRCCWCPSYSPRPNATCSSANWLRRAGRGHRD